MRTDHARQRTRYASHADTFNAFVRQSSSEGHGPSVSFSGDTAYSYGTPIARRVRNERGDVAYLLAGRSYSPSTGRHKLRVWQAAYHKSTEGPGGSRPPLFTVPEVDRGGWNDTGWTHAVALESYAERIRAEMDRAGRARVYKSTEHAERIRAERDAYCAFFGLPVPLDKSA